MDFELEICVNSIHSALAAQQGGASRIELCDNMREGGTTPSAGVIKQCKKLLTIPVFPIIRPRGGDFLYSGEEFKVMKRDIQFCQESGCEGVVIGILRADGTIDMDRCAQLIALARPMEITFHRAFDRCANLEKGLEDIILLGCERVLTSGGETSAEVGIHQLKQLILQADGRISVMPGSGVDEHNILRLVHETGAKQFHSTAKTAVLSAMHYKGRGKLAQQDGDFPILETSADKVGKMKQLLAGLSKNN